jgi:hypothetical protein
MKDMVSIRKMRGLADWEPLPRTSDAAGEGALLLDSDTGDFFREGKQIV